MWQDFKTSRKGNFISLYAHLEKIYYDEARDRLTIASFLSDSRDDLRTVEDDVETEQKKDLLEGLDLVELNLEKPPELKFLLPPEGEAWWYVYKRKLFGNGRRFLFSRTGPLMNRVIFPFEYDGKVFYYQARTIYNDVPKYMNPSRDPEKGLYVRASEVLYPFKQEYGFLFITEGVVDCISLQNCGLNATCTQGCHVSNFQVDILRQSPCKIVIAYDNDEAGNKGMGAFQKSAKKFRVPTIYRVSPPDEYKDWNQFYCDSSEEDVRNYVNNNLTEWTWEKEMLLQLNRKEAF